MDVTADGTVLDGFDLTGGITVHADDVTIRNSKVSNGVVQQNYLAGGAYTVACDASIGTAAISAVQLIGNRFGLPVNP